MDIDAPPSARGKKAKAKRSGDVSDGPSTSDGVHDGVDQAPEPQEPAEPQPVSREVHIANIQTAATAEEREYARMLMHASLLMPESMWMDWIREKEEQRQASPTLESALEVLEVYKQACSDLLSIPIRKAYANFIVSLYYSARGLPFPEALQDPDVQPDPSRVDPIASEVFTVDFVREELAQAVDPLTRHHLARSQEAWQVLHDFELDTLRRDPSAEATSHMLGVYKSRLAEPHQALQATHQLTSTFISTYMPDQYEGTMIELQKVYNATQKTTDMRDKHEQTLRSHPSPEAYKSYIAWEMEVKKPALDLVHALYERALASYPEDTDLWLDYLDFIRGVARKQSSASTLEAETFQDLAVDTYCHRAVRALPFSGSLAASCIRLAEAFNDIAEAATLAATLFQRAISWDRGEEGLTDVVEVTLAMADFERHVMTGEDGTNEVEDILRKALAKVDTITSGKSDPMMRLEKYLIRHLERQDAFDKIDAFYSGLAKKHPEYSTYYLSRVEFEMKRNNVEAARKHFVAASKKRLDYPEYLFDAWVAFEHRDGTLATLEKALEVVKKEMVFVNARRYKAMLASANASAAAPVAETAPIASSSTEPQASSSTAPQEETSTKAALAGESSKRPLEAMSPSDAAPEESSAKRARTEGDDAAASPAPVNLKRDRENSTVIVYGLPQEVEEIALRRLFRDCGEIREIKLRPVDGNPVATVEFTSRDAVPAALTKDKKRIDDSEISVQPDWASTLYVTNFPESFDAADLQRLFEQFGPIFETRWPSKRLKNSRRFAYVQFVTADTAKKALVLHKTEQPPGSDLRISVQISDPSRKQKRSDTDANKREIYITGLPRATRTEDLHKLFGEFGPIKGARIGTNEDGTCRGFGFVDFEDQASAEAALSKNNTEYKKRRLAVIIADSRVAHANKQPESGQGKRADAKMRSVRVRGLPPSALEPLVQQIFEKFGAVDSVEINPEGDKEREAVVVFVDPATAGKVALSAGDVEYEGHKLRIDDMTSRTAATRGGRGGARGGRRLGIGAARSSFAASTFLSATSNPSASSSSASASASAGAGAGAGQQGQAGASDAVGDDVATGTSAPAASRSQADFRALLGKKT